MIGELEENHGVVLARLVRGGTSAGPFSVTALGRSGYIVDGRIALFVKYSTSRMSPWSFNFSRAHQTELGALSADYEQVFVVLVCGRDGIACLSRAELGRVLDDHFHETEWVKASRRPREKYLVTGTDDRRGFKVGDNEFPAKVVAALEPALA